MASVAPQDITERVHDNEIGDTGAERIAKVFISSSPPHYGIIVYYESLKRELHRLSESYVKRHGIFLFIMNR